jgi:hypothetical protein
MPINALFEQQQIKKERERVVLDVGVRKRMTP